MTRRRAVLVAPKGRDETPKSQQATINALAMIARAGFELIGIIDPRDHLDALRMIIDGRADIVVSTRPDHLPAVRHMADEAWFMSLSAHPSTYPDALPPGVHRRPYRLLRADEPDWRDPVPEPEEEEEEERPVSADHRRPEPVVGRRTERLQRPERVADSNAGRLPAQRRTRMLRQD